ncbi:NADPH oxidase family protein [Aspergillus novofumigatus IBT 16806]|uniref:Ferric oxidoreductase domain-containing protein n=1 Tax=Aspergillus novofumigatus (strain IBT 16806) TaxID=1392255 RepID=A0A2I1BU32_ASPN1|nr:uncharacterized protein P174DRAFT_464609 [Aspergillus novofumigatus IBT 16806]PKX88862.1 hypothetical protein P174DRAFT_464609 [Aspergillus novofumigatus IBT 16806]
MVLRNCSLLNIFVPGAEDALTIYAIVAGSIFAGLFLAWTLSTLAKYVLLHLSYAAINAFLIIFRADSLTGTGRRAGELALVNLIFPLSAIHLSNVANLLGISWSTYRKIHHTTGWMAMALLAFHISVAGAASLGTQHLPSAFRPPKLYLVITLVVFRMTSFFRLVTLLAIISFNMREAKEANPVITAGQAGQYINLWLPLTHPFTDTLELLVQLYYGLSVDLLHHAPAAAQSLISFLALFTGPHGTSEDVSYYESILVITSRFRIAAAVPYLKKMIYSYNTCTSQVRHLHLVWQVELIKEVTAAQSLLNNLLKDNIILNISIYMGNSLKQNKLPFNYDSIISLKASGG